MVQRISALRKELREQDEYSPQSLHTFMQRDILTVVKEPISPLSYSDIKPDGIDGNAFNHHLKLWWIADYTKSRGQ